MTRNGPPGLAGSRADGVLRSPRLGPHRLAGIRGKAVTRETAARPSAMARGRRWRPLHVPRRPARPSRIQAQLDKPQASSTRVALLTFRNRPEPPRDYAVRGTFIQTVTGPQSPAGPLNDASRHRPDPVGRPIRTERASVHAPAPTRILSLNRSNPARCFSCEYSPINEGSSGNGAAT